jgi:FkbM family methyltransferase
MIKNVISYMLSKNGTIEIITIDKVKFKIYANPMISNSRLLLDIKGYNLNYKFKKGDTVVDAGAYNGLSTIYAARKVGPKGKVIAIEPDPYTLQVLTRNINLNHLKNVIIVPKGLYSKPKKMKFDVQGIGSRLQMYNQDIPTINSILVDTLDTILLKDLKINKVDFIQMDIEGAEIEALKGCKKIIMLNKGIRFAIASYHIVNGERTSRKLEKIFTSFGLKPVTKNKFHLTTYSNISV